MDAFVTMNGWVGTDVQAYDGPSAFATFRLGATPRFRRNGDWVDGPTNWISVRCYRSLAENVAGSVRKGEPVVVTGRLRTSSWTDQSGETRDRLVLEASVVGHDLSLGTTTFRRTEKSVPEEVSEDEREAMISSMEQRQAAEVTAVAG
ncbi:single-stranded DNA-binding protein [Desertihabitans brevis]|uniref:single-stranded DNA-binding protein n=1 Tax=Desertihabitans brevis TaxID=2268447 RepID=UPI00131441DC|nr:single-stranded DNA-binding protein [Desertihabitans brevis]